MDKLKTKVFEAIGQASMCWDQTPSGVFDSTQAKQVADELWREIEAENAALKKVVQAAWECKRQFMSIDDGFFTGLIPPQFVPIAKALAELDQP